MVAEADSGPASSDGETDSKGKGARQHRISKIQITHGQITPEIVEESLQQLLEEIIGQQQPFGYLAFTNNKPHLKVITDVKSWVATELNLFAEGHLLCRARLCRT
ncbi:hypothetical protein M501DRAFT_985449 [Patellaria atrata CBS 101060]|uniref:Uncharacterized protein n=1 Tax=Patellaria atrata CBS 101060 TaxID=1346257 RepID=A0A9P4VX17_9PEZI|nr:hypothetical protein M501DRAFT_985449 [Patellaria atrata CBS 101060]